MRLTRWAFFVVFLSALVPLSCRKTVAPNTDRNRAPDTYLTAAPLDSIGGGSLNRAPYRFHAHWSGADIDGQVVGFYVAVTETLPPQPPEFRPVPLPAPKPYQWRYTTRTDSVFIFDVYEGLGTDRDHGLYVFAVDNEGKSDPTPALTRFTARDQNLPGIIWVTHRAEGRIFLPAPGGGVQEVPFVRELTDGQDPAGAKVQPRDTIPVGSAVYFAWNAFDRDWGSSILGYRYKLFENDFVKTDSSGNSVEYGTGVGSATTPVPIGPNAFRVRAVDEAGGTTFPDSVRRFVVNFDPETWWAGPDTTDPTVQAAIQHDGRGMYIPSPDGTPPAALAKWLSLDRFNTLPAARKTAAGTGMGTLLEKVRFPTEYRFYIHADGDTVARNAESISLFAGGGDKDSPYEVLIQPGNPPTDKGVVGTPGPANGSPIGVDFRIVRRYVDGHQNQPAFTAIYPNFNPLSAGFNPDVYFTGVQDFSGTSFAQVRAVDGNLGRDRRVGDPLEYMDAYTDGTLPADKRNLRQLVLTWNVNFNPYFLTEEPQFAPRADTLIMNPGFTARLFMRDPDSTSGSNRAPFLVRVRTVAPGQQLGRDEGWQPRDPLLTFSGDSFFINIPTDLPPGRNEFEFELSDLPGNDLAERRIVLVKIPFYWQTGP